MSQISSNTLSRYHFYMQCMSTNKRKEFEKLLTKERKQQYNAAKRFCQSNKEISLHDRESSIGTTICENKVDFKANNKLSITEKD